VTEFGFKKRGCDQWNVRCAGNFGSSSDHEGYNSEPVLRNLRPERRLEGILPEPFPRELPRRPCRAAKRCGEGPGALRLRFEPAERRVDGFGADAVGREVMPDRVVAVAPAGERSGPQAGESRVVDISDSFERVERLGTRLVSDTRLCEAVVELAA